MSMRSWINRHLYQVFITCITVIVASVVFLYFWSNRNEKQFNQFITGIYNKQYSLVEKSLDKFCNKKDKFGRPPALVAMYAKDYEMFELIIKCNKVNVNSKDERGVPLLFNALRQKDNRYVELLLKQPKLNLYIRDIDGNDAIIACVDFNNATYLKMVMDAMPEIPFVKNKEGKTALDYAKKYGNINIINELKILEVKNEKTH